MSTPLASPSIAAIFDQRLTSIEEALKNNQLIDTSLNGVSKWSLAFLGRWLIQPLYYLVTGTDTLADIRIGSVVKRILSEATAIPPGEFTTYAKTRVDAILTTFQRKSTKYSDDIKNCLGQVALLNVAAAPALRSTTPGAPLDTVQTVTQTVNNNAYNIHCLLARTTPSFFFSPLAMATTGAVLVTGAPDAKKQELREQTGLRQDNLLSDIQKLQEKSSASIVTYLAPTKAPQFVDGVEQALKDSCKMELVVKGAETKGRFARINDAAKKATSIANLIPVTKDFAGTALVTAAKVVATLPTFINPAKAVTRTCTFSTTKAELKLALLPEVQIKKFDATEYSLVELPYENGLCKIMIIPNFGKSLSDIMKDLHPENIAIQRTHAQPATVNLYMPRQMSESKQLQLDTLLSAIGVKPEKLFDEDIHSIVTACTVEESSPTTPPAVPATTAVSVQELYVDRSYYFLIMNGDTLVVQGQFDSADGFKKATRSGWTA